jgi:pyridoxine 5-phosphate synthase
MKLGVNIDHLATLRQARSGREPDPVAAAAIATLAGASSIVCHLREDRRHIQDRDLELLRATVHTRLNLEMAASPEMVEKALMVRPDVVTLVPERPGERTTEGGLDVSAQYSRLKEVVGTLNAAGIEVSLFINPETSAIRDAAKTGAQAIELHTGIYATAKNAQERDLALEDLRSAALAGTKMKFFVAAGHDLDYHNAILVASIPQIQELNIGHAIIARASLVGLSKAVEEMRYLIERE